MILRLIKSRRGFTLVELLLFSAIFALVSVAFIGIFIVITRVQSREGSSIGVSQEGQFLLQTISSLIQQSSLIQMTADVSTTTITLRMATATIDPTYIYVTNGQAFLQETATGTPQPLTTSRVTLSDISFMKRSNPYGHDSLKVSLTISANTSSTQQTASQVFNTSIARNSPSVFGSDLEANPSVNLGASSNDISSINNTLFFLGGMMGISDSGESPKDRLQIDNGGVKFTSLPSRPACTSALRGTLWFTLDNVNGDSMTACLMSSTGVPYWAVGGVQAEYDTTVDNTGSAGADNDITAAKNNLSYVYASYYDPFSNSLRFSSSSQGVWPAPRYTTVDGGAVNVGQYNSITAPTTSTVYISYYDLTNNALKFAWSTNGGRNWSSKALTSTGNQGQYTSIDAPSVSNVYVSYYDVTNSNLMFIKSQDGGTSWGVPVLVDGTNDVGQDNSMVVPQDDTIYICYSDLTTDDLKFAWSTNYGASWSRSTLDSAITGGTGCSISAPTTSTIYISYYSAKKGSALGYLKFIRSLSGPTGFQSPYTIDGNTGAGDWSGVVSLDEDRVFVGYHNSVPNELHWAFSQLGGAQSTWSLATAAISGGTYSGKNVHAVAIDNLTYVVGYTQGNTNLKAYKLIQTSPVFY